MVYPAAGFAPMLATKGVPVAEFNMEETPCTGAFRYLDSLHIRKHPIIIRSLQTGSLVGVLCQIFALASSAEVDLQASLSSGFASGAKLWW